MFITEATPRSPTKAPRAAEVHIEELVPPGFNLGDRQAIAKALQHEVAQLIAAGQLPALNENSLALKQIDVGAFQHQAGPKPVTDGTHIAQSVFRGMRQQMRASVGARAIQGARGRKP
jgi:hypothetical protein